MPEEPQSETGRAECVGSTALFGDALEPRDACKSSSGLVGAGGDCPSMMREHLWSIERDGMIECLWCFERRHSKDRG